MLDTTETEAGASAGADKTPFTAPSTPGWKILLAAAMAVVSAEGRPDKATLTELETQLRARKNEKIPAKERQKVMEAVIAAGPKTFPCLWQQYLTDFLISQVGEEGVRMLLAESQFELVACSNCGMFHVYDTAAGPEERRLFKEYLLRERMSGPMGMMGGMANDFSSEMEMALFGSILLGVGNLVPWYPGGRPIFGGLAKEDLFAVFRDESLNEIFDDQAMDS